MPRDRRCIYCGGQLLKHPAHPTWRVCPVCEPNMFGALRHPDSRGAPSKPGGGTVST